MAKKCAVCKKPITGNSLKKYCSYKCSYAVVKKKRRKVITQKHVSDLAQDIAWAITVKERAGNKCEVCGATKYLNSHHIFSRSIKKTRYDLENGVCLCPRCHLWNEKLSAHKSPEFFRDWLIEHRGIERFEAIKKKAKSL